jgi:uncharacterized protein YecE (DUF72 family)
LAHAGLESGVAILIGTSGWTYPHWQKAFFPKELPSAERLHFYAQQFSSVEVNTTFYGTPKKATVRAWHDAVPARFRFAIKASRYITHNQKLLRPRKSSVKLFRAIEPIGGQTAALLFQFPPWFQANPKRLQAFLKKMPADYRYAFEFRHTTWFCEEVYDILRQTKSALCLWELKGELSPIEVTANFVYVRLHGPKHQAYQGSYPDKILRDWKRKVDGWTLARKNVLIYFDNDEKGYAPVNARRLGEMLELKGNPRP